MCFVLNVWPPDQFAPCPCPSVQLDRARRDRSPTFASQFESRRKIERAELLICSAHSSYFSFVLAFRSRFAVDAYRAGLAFVSAAAAAAAARTGGFSGVTAALPFGPAGA
jgi:hypothetical protein